MNRRTNDVLGKRSRRNTSGDQPAMDSAECDILRKRLRPRGKGVAVQQQTSPEPSRPRNGLLTPEPSVLTDSSLPTTLEANSDDEANHRPQRHIFPFMKLPAELRLHVYYMALVRNTPLYMSTDRESDPVIGDNDTSNNGSSNSVTSPMPPFSDQQSGIHIRRARGFRTREAMQQEPRCESTRSRDPVVPEILRLNQQIYKEARQLLYAENVFTLNLSSGIHTLSTLHQRSRSLIKHVVLTIPSHHDILDGFADLVRLGLRYCWGLKSFKIILHASLPDDGRGNSGTNVYANAFHILRWLPQKCSVVLEGCVSETLKKVVMEEGRLMSVLDKTSYLKRQHQMPESF